MFNENQRRRSDIFGPLQGRYRLYEALIFRGDEGYRDVAPKGAAKK